MIAVDIINIINKYKETYMVFNPEKISDCEYWIKFLTTIPEDIDIPFIYNKNEDIIEALSNDTIIFREYSININEDKKEISKPDIIDNINEYENEGFQILDDDLNDIDITNYIEHNNSTKSMDNDLGILEDENRQLKEQIELLYNQIDELSSENEKLHTITTLSQERQETAIPQDIINSSNNIQISGNNNAVNNKSEPIPLNSFQKPFTEPHVEPYSEPLENIYDDTEKDDFEKESIMDDKIYNQVEEENNDQQPVKKRKLTKQVILKIATAIILGVIAIVGVLWLKQSKVNQKAAVMPPEFPAQILPQPLVQTKFSSMSTTTQPLVLNQQEVVNNEKTIPPIPKTKDADKAKQNKKEPASKTKTNTKSDIKSLVISIKNNMFLNIRCNTNTNIRIPISEHVIDVSGENTANWIVDYDKNNNILSIKPLLPNSKNTIIVKTNKNEYTINLSVTI